MLHGVSGGAWRERRALKKEPLKKERAHSVEPKNRLRKERHSSIEPFFPTPTSHAPHDRDLSLGHLKRSMSTCLDANNVNKLDLERTVDGKLQNNRVHFVKNRLTLDSPCTIKTFPDFNENSFNATKCPNSGLSSAYSSSCLDSNFLAKMIEHKYNSRNSTPVTQRPTRLADLLSPTESFYGEPVYANTPDILDGLNSPKVEHTKSSHNGMRTSLSLYLDSNFLAKKIKHKYNARKNATPSVTPKMSGSKSMMSFSKSTYDLRNDISSPCRDSGSDKKVQLRAKNRHFAQNVQKSGLTATMSSSKTVHDLKQSLDKKASGSLVQLCAKPIPVTLLDAVSNQLKRECIDLTKEPYTDPVCTMYHEPSPSTIYHEPSTIYHLPSAAA